MSDFKRIKNMTRQGLEVVVKKAGGGYDHLWIPAKTAVTVNADSITSLVRVAEQRKLLKISNA